ncbi:MAG: hypothetical protein BGO55_13605 [Sphingobacteriales bacterium 50-39]|nr:hypothetical protein [Sphingobacteriales bacterium]OJW57332.1 MAG: hypothetical protein BGO55_13605 [Sphingobacteriales bacterium 50-39]
MILQEYKVKALGLVFSVFAAINFVKGQDHAPGEASFFPLMAWDDVRDEATIKKMAECGINLIAFTPTSLLDACKKYGVKAILYDAKVAPQWDLAFKADEANIALREVIKKYDKHPAVFGYHLKDEPDGNQFKELGRSSGLVNKLAPGKWAYINLPPGLGAWYDSSYVQLFVDQCKPKYISYDNYAIGEGDRFGFSWGYWANIWDIRSAALRNNIPFHTILLTAGHFGYRAPSFHDLSLQVYGALAYGAKGLGYYKFVGETLQVLHAPELGNWNGAPLDEFHDVNPVPYYNLRKMNKRIQAMAPVLLKLKSTDVYHIGGDSIPQRNHGITDSSLIQGMESGVAFIVGEFTHVENGGGWIMIVNKDLKASTFVRPKFSKKINTASIKILSQVTGKLVDWPGIWFSLEPGQGVLLKVDVK